MRVPFGENIRGWGNRVGHIDWLALAEKLLLALLALQCARLLWAVLTPVGSFGAWEGRHAQFPSVPARQALFSSFDPFYRGGSAQQGGGVVTSLAITVYGIRLNEGTGLGSAIVAGPDGVQNSIAVGEEIMPGVVLKAVAFDHILIDRGGSEEQVFLDQSQSVPGAAPGTALSAPAIIGHDNPTVESIRSDVGITPRMQNGRVTGLIVTSRGQGFQDAGFLPGDIISRIDGQPVSSAADIQALQGRLMPGARISLSVERGASEASIVLTLQGQ